MLDSWERYRRIARMTLAFSGVTGGIVLCAWLVLTRPQPVRHEQPALPPEVGVIPVTQRTAAFPVIGHGTVRPKKQVNIIPQISGPLTFVHPNLAQGKVIPEGELLFEVDRTVYDARLKQANAEVRGLDAAVRRQEKEFETLAVRIENARRLTAIDESDYETSKRLYEVEKVGTQRDVDALLQKYLRAKDALAELETQFQVIPLTIEQTQAQLDGARARLAQVEHDLVQTRINCPFKARVESVQANVSQVVTAFFSIATLTDMEAFELAVGVDPRELRWLDHSVHPNGLTDDDEDDGPRVDVRWSLRGQEFHWTGYVSRFERVDELTRTAKMVVEVRDEDMTAQVIHGGEELTLNLAIGMFCRAALPGRTLENAILVPRHAIHEDRFVYVVEREPGATAVGRLAEREITMLRSVGDDVLVDYQHRGEGEVCELQAGDLLVTSRLIRPVIGMPVRLREHTVTSQNTTALSLAGHRFDFDVVKHALSRSRQTLLLSPLESIK